ncbi:hypothetical protein, partial [Vibrio diabolicus]|uniref:hypothetical protein n=1 Tax=Vibrio diabolicus TaxID=50719 RepID=UPI0029418B5D
IIVSSLLLLLIKIGKEYLKGKEVLLWSERFPTTYLNDVNPRDKLIKTYKGFFLVVFILLPTLSIIHFNNKVISHGDIGYAKSNKVIVNNIFYIEKISDTWSKDNYLNRHCMGQDLKPPSLCIRSKENQGGITWFPLVSALLMVAVSFFATLSSLLFLFSILMPN